MRLSAKIPGFVGEIMTALACAGHAAYAVGGCVRDLMLGAPPQDWDIATDAVVGEVQGIFEKTVPIGARYGTVTVLLPGGSAEVTTFRRDGEYGDGRRPESVDFVSDLTEDLARRDFTVNAMAMDINGDMTDLFGGTEDLDRGLIRCVGDPERRFSEDALRMLRAVRFSARLGFEIEEKTLAALKKLAPAASRLSAERVGEELKKTLASPRPELAGELVMYGLMARFVSPTALPAPLERLRDTPPALRPAVFAVLEAPMGCGAGELLYALRFDRKTARLAAGAGEVYSRLAPHIPSLRPDSPELLLALADGETDAVLAACAAHGVYGAALEAVNSGRVVRVGELAVTGAQAAGMGLRGPEVGKALRCLSHDVTLGLIPNTPRSLTERLKMT